MPAEPPVKRTVAFVDGQNLFYAARAAFGYSHPNYDSLALARAVCDSRRWDLRQLRFYTGVHAATREPFWARFWSEKLLEMSRQGTHVFSRPLRYRTQTFQCPDGSVQSFDYAIEKGIDVRIAVDVIRLALNQEYDVALIFSQDQDLSEVAHEIRLIGREQSRWIKVASAFPTTQNRRGIDKTDWISIDRATYDRCIDPRDYRPKKTTP